MELTSFGIWLTNTSVLVVGAVLGVALIVATFAGAELRRANERRAAQRPEGEARSSQEGYIVSAVLGLMALLLGFTFSLAVDRYDARRVRVLESANAVGTAYLQTQLLGEPHRTRISRIMMSYVDNVIVLAKASDRSTQLRLLARDDELLTELWQATAPAFDSIRGLDFSSTYVSSINNLIDMDSARRATRMARVPTEVFVLLFCYFIVTAGVLGYVLTGNKGRLSAGFLLLLMVLSLLMVMDIDRPATGGVRELQTPMEDLQKAMAVWTPALFDRWRSPVAATPP